MPEHRSVTLEDTPLIGVTRSYSYSLEQISSFHHEMRYQSWHDFLGNAPTVPPVLYGPNEARPSQDRDDEQEVFYTIALAQDQTDGYALTGRPVILQSGEYVTSTYGGLGAGVQELILTVYGTYIPMLNLTRHKGQNIERHYPAEDVRAGDRPTNPRCKLLTPIRR